MVVAGGSTAASIETAALARRFGEVRAVDGIDLHVPTGSVFGFLGPNGSGKTTTIRMLLGLVRPTAGEARLLGERVTAGAPVVARVGALVERPAFYPFLSPLENLLLFGVTAGEPEAALRGRLPGLIGRVGLEGAIRRPVGGFSTGMLQRLALGLALLRDPELLILDEPTNGLDPAGVVEVRELIRSVAAEGRTVFLSTHVLSEVEQVCDRVAVLDHGRIVAQARTADLAGGAGRLRIRFDPGVDRDGAAILLRGGGFDPRPDRGGRDLVIAGRGEAGSEVIRLLAGGGIFPAEVVAEREGLEAVFLELTGASGGAADPRPAATDPGAPP